MPFQGGEKGPILNAWRAPRAGRPRGGEGDPEGQTGGAHGAIWRQHRGWRRRHFQGKPRFSWANWGPKFGDGVPKRVREAALERPRRCPPPTRPAHLNEAFFNPPRSLRSPKASPGIRGAQNLRGVTARTPIFPWILRSSPTRTPQGWSGCRHHSKLGGSGFPAVPLPDGGGRPQERGGGGTRNEPRPANSNFFFFFSLYRQFNESKMMKNFF